MEKSRINLSAVFTPFLGDEHPLTRLCNGGGFACWYLVRLGSVPPPPNPRAAAHTRSYCVAHSFYGVAHPREWDTTLMMRLPLHFPPIRPPPHSHCHCWGAGGGICAASHGNTGGKGEKSGCGGRPPVSPFPACPTAPLFLPWQSSAIPGTAAFQSFKLGGVWVKNV